MQSLPNGDQIIKCTHHLRVASLDGAYTAAAEAQLASRDHRLDCDGVRGTMGVVSSGAGPLNDRLPVWGMGNCRRVVDGPLPLPATHSDGPFTRESTLRQSTSTTPNCIARKPPRVIPSVGSLTNNGKHARRHIEASTATEADTTRSHANRPVCKCQWEVVPSIHLSLSPCLPLTNAQPASGEQKNTTAEKMKDTRTAKVAADISMAIGLAFWRASNGKKCNHRC